MSPSPTRQRIQAVWLSLLVLAGGLSLVHAAVPGTRDASGGGSGVLGTRLEEAPLAFEPNAGRTDPRVDFLARSVAGGSLYLTSGEAVLSLPQEEGRSRALRLVFPGADPRAEARGLRELPGKVNSFIGDDPSTWRSGISTFGRVRYPDLYPGIDLDFYGNQRDLEYDFRLAPRADPARLAVDLRGADSVGLEPNGDLLIGVGATIVRQRAPEAYQRVGGERLAVPSSYELAGSTVSFRVGSYDRSRPLVIDPVVLAYSTYLGGGGLDRALDMAVDGAGAVYVTGMTDSADFPTQDHLFPDQASTDAFVTKLNPDSGGAVTLAYSTYLGASALDIAFDIAVDSAGAAYVTGFTESQDFPTQDEFQTDQPGTDAFVTKLNPDSGGAVTLAYSTYLGGGLTDIGIGIDVDTAGSAYITGRTDSVNFPLQDPFQADQGGIDGFATKLNPDTGGPVTLAYSTYLGGLDDDLGSQVSVDSAGAAYVAGFTGSTDFPTQDAFQAHMGNDDAFVTKLNPDTGGPVTLAYSTYLGGLDDDIGSHIAVDSAGAAYVSGHTSSTDFPTQDAFQTDQGNDDVFVTKLDPDTGGPVTLAYSTYLGGASVDFSGAIAVDSAGAAYVIGHTFSADFPVQDALFPDQALDDAFVTMLNPDTGGAVSLAFSTYLGASGPDTSGGIAVTSAGEIYVSGSTESVNFPTAEAFQTDQGGEDAWVARIVVTPPDTDPPETTITKGPKKKTGKRTARFTFVASEPGSTFECRLDIGSFEPCDSPEDVRVKRGRHVFRVRATDASGNTDPTPARHRWKVRRPR